MKLFVISDTHGKLSKVYEVYETLTGIDAIIHLGDCSADASDLEKNLGVDVISVKGNMDGACSKENYQIIHTECGKIYLSHGHLENVKMQYQSIYYRAEEHGCIAAMFGHTHKPIFEERNGIHLINPGSLSLPCDGSKGSYVIVNTSPEGLSGSIVYYKEKQEKEPSNHPPKVQGGYLRDLLNYSDRF